MGWIEDMRRAELEERQAKRDGNFSQKKVGQKFSRPAVQRPDYIHRYGTVGHEIDAETGVDVEKVGLIKTPNVRFSQDADPDEFQGCIFWDGANARYVSRDTANFTDEPYLWDSIPQNIKNRLAFLPDEGKHTVKE